MDGSSSIILRLEPSDIATIKSVADGYKLEEVYGAMRKLWSGDSLMTKDMEKKKRLGSTKIMMVDEGPEQAVHAATLVNDEDNEPNDGEDADEVYEAMGEEWMDDETSPEVLAAFQKMKYKEARQALVKARTNRGFFPTRSSRSGARSTTLTGSGTAGPHVQFSGKCMRCGKIGHKARDCRQTTQRRPNSDLGGSVGFVGWCLDGVGEKCPILDEDEQLNPWLLEEDLDHLCSLAG